MRARLRSRRIASEELFGEVFLSSDVLDLDDTGGMMREYRQRLQRVQPSL